MTKEEASTIQLFQIVRWNPTSDCFNDPEHKWLQKFCGKLAIVTQKIIWNDSTGGEEIHLRFPQRYSGENKFYESIQELEKDFINGRDIFISEGFDTGATEIDMVSRYQEPHGECNNNPNGCVSSVCPETCSKFIDEDKLNELARKETGCLDPTNVDDPNYTGYHCYVAGYRKAKEE